MRIFDSARSIGSIHAVVRTMREDGIIRVIGPFRRRNGTFVYSVEDFVVTERELLDLAEAGKLDPCCSICNFENRKKHEH
jgi:hypothetical protein